MGERSQESSDSLDDIFEPIFSDMSEDDIDEISPTTTDKQRLEEKRLREELGYYDLELDDF